MNEGARQVTAERWAELAWLREIPAGERPRWVLAPLEMNFATAHRWARQVGGEKIIALATGETLVRLAEKSSQWALP
jgi:hypothetical protein